jgi:DNA polymerase sigma
VPFLESFDICFLNDIAVANSSLIREYSIVDPRVRPLMLAVKKWTKAFKIDSAKDNYISSYAWINLVIFYLQCLGFVPNLQSTELIKAVGVTPNPEGNYWHFVNNLDTCTLTWNQVEKGEAWKQPAELQAIPVSALLYGFFEFYTRRFPSGVFAVASRKEILAFPS